MLKQVVAYMLCLQVYEPRLSKLWMPMGQFLLRARVRGGKMYAQQAKFPNIFPIRIMTGAARNNLGLLSRSVKGEKANSSV